MLGAVTTAAILLVAAPSALADSPVDIQQAATDYANGTATPTEIAEVQGSGDFVAWANGVTDPAQWPYPINGSVADANGYTVTANPNFQAGGYYNNLQSDLVNSPAGGGTADAVGADTVGAGSDLGIIDSLGAAAPVLALGTADAIIIGHDIALFNAPSSPTPTSWLGNLQADDVKRIWETTYSTDPGTGLGCYIHTNNAQGLSPLGSQDGGTSNEIYSQVATCKYTGAYVMVRHGAATNCCGYASEWWIGGREVDGVGMNGGTPDPAGPNEQCYEGYNYWPPWPGGQGVIAPGSYPAGGGVPSGDSAHWTKNVAPVMQGPNKMTCHTTGNFPISGYAYGINYAFTYEVAHKAGLDFKRNTTTCPSGTTCHQATTYPSSHWCATGGSSFASCLASVLASGKWPGLQQFLNSGLGVTVGGSPTPRPGTVAVPNCGGMAPAACKSALSSAGITGTPTEITLPPQQNDLTKPAGAVVTTSPAAGAYVDTASVVQLNENSNPLPIAIPAPQPNEPYATYIARLQADGLVGTITEQDLTDAQASPMTGPGDAVRTSPAAGTQVAPSTSIVVYANPATSSQPGTGGGEGAGGPPVGPTLPGISIPGLPTPCNVFPFGIPCWVKDQVAGMANVTPVAPAFTLHAPSAFGGGTWNVDLGHPLGGDFSGIMSVVRPILLVLSMVLLMFWLGSFALGGSAGGGGSAEATEE